MLKNNNTGAVKLISHRSMKSNRVRNMFAVSAVILTTLMLTSVFTIMLSLGKNMSTMQLRRQGTRSSIYIDCPTQEQIDKVKECKYISDVGTFTNTGSVVLDSDNDTSTPLSYYDKTEFEKNFTPAIGEIKGKYPTEENQVMLSSLILKSLGIDDPVINMNVSLTVKEKDEKTSQKEFILSGWYKDFDSWSGCGPALVSENYITGNGFSVEKDGSMSISCKANKQNDAYDNIASAITLSNGQEIRTTFDIQGENSSTMLIITIVIILISLIIVLSGYLLIYNVLYISVTKDIRFYGMLKTIGTSPSQIKTIVKSQALKFLVIGVPVGILLGTAISFIAAPMAMNMMNPASSSESIMPTDITFNPMIYIGTIIFAMLTVILSCRKPARIASSVSPVEALKYNGVKGGGNIKSKNTVHGGKPYKMAFRNVFREKKRAILVFASLFMGTMAFLSVNTFIGCMKIDNYIDMYVPNDYALFTYSYADPDDKDNTDNIEQINADNEKIKSSITGIIDQIRNTDGMKFVEVNRCTFGSFEFDKEIFTPFIKRYDTENLDNIISECENGQQPLETKIISVSPRMIKLYNKKAHTKIDVDKFEKGQTALIGQLDNAADGDSIIGKTINLTDSQSGKSVQLQIGSVSSHECAYGLNLSYINDKSFTPSYVLVSDSVIDKLTDDPSYESIIADCKSKSKIDAVDSKIFELAKSNSDTCIKSFDIKNKEVSEFKSSMSSLNILTSGISIVLILIGVLNFVNVMLTGVYTRRKELAVLESVGMTKKQIRRMLMFEGLYYAVITILLILTAGNGLIYVFASLALKIADYAVFYYPFILMGIIVAFILIVCTVVPTVVYKIASKESVTERLRDVE